MGMSAETWLRVCLTPKSVGSSVVLTMVRAPVMSGFVSFLQLDGICKRFPGVLALDNVSCAIARGSCHAIIGENGAGKSTLGKILAGVYPPDRGTIQLDGQVIQPSNPIHARQL